MEDKFKTYFLVGTLAVIVLLGFFWWYISRDGKEVAKDAEADGFITVYDVDSGNLRTVEMNPVSTKVFRNPGGAKYLLQSENPDQSTLIYDVNGLKLKEVLLAGKQIATSNPGYVLIQKMFKEDKKPWEMTYDYGLVVPKTEDEVRENSTEHTLPAKIIMWSKSNLAVYDKDENKIYEELFFGQDLNIEKVIPCEGSRIVVFTSEYEYPQEYDPDWEYYQTNQRISFSVIDYQQNNKDFQLDINDVNLQTIDDFEFSFEDIQWPIYCGTKLASVEEFSNIDIASSQDRTHVTGIINNSTVFLVNIEMGKTVFTKPLIRSVNGTTNSKVFQIEVSNGGVVHILRYYTGNEDLLVGENYSSTDNVTQIHILEGMEN